MFLLVLPAQSAAGDDPPPAAARPEPVLAELPAGEFRLLESHPAASARDWLVESAYLLIGPARPLRLHVGGPALVRLAVRSEDYERVRFRLRLGERSDTLGMQLTPLWPAGLAFRVPDGTHAVALEPNTTVLVRILSSRRIEPSAAGIEQPEETQSRAEEAPGPAPIKSFPEEEPDLGYWATVGFGGGAQLGPVLGGMSWGGSLNLRIRHYLIQLRYVHALQVEDQEAGPLPSEHAWELAPLFGLGLRGRWGWISGAFGIGLAGGVRRGDFIEADEQTGRELYERDGFYTVGFPLDLQLFATPYACLGIGIEVFANLNLERSFFGALLAVQLGRM